MITIVIQKQILLYTYIDDIITVPTTWTTKLSQKQHIYGKHLLSPREKFEYQYVRARHWLMVCLIRKQFI